MVIGRTNRFHGRGSLQRHYNHSKSVRSGTLSLRYAVNDRRKDYRVAVVVSRKVSKSAVVRNRIRRRIYENVRNLYGYSQLPHDLVFIVYDERVAAMPAAELAADVAKLCRKAGMAATRSPRHDIVEPKE